MKTLAIIKAITIILGILILTGFILVVVKISEKSQNSKPIIMPPHSDIVLSDEENITTMTPCGDFVCVLVTGEARTSSVFVLDPSSGTLQRRIVFNKSEK